MEVLHFKCGILDNLVKFVNRGGAGEGLKQQLEEEKEKSEVQLQKYRLHQILKKKVVRKRRESVLGNEMGEEVSQLEQSIVMIEKDLGIENEEEEESRLNLSAMISHSLAGLEATPISRVEMRDESMMSEVASLNIGNHSMEKSRAESVEIEPMVMSKVPEAVSVSVPGEKPTLPETTEVTAKK